MNRDNVVNIFTSQCETFANAKCMFVEYHDIIKMPMLPLLFAIQDDKLVNKAFDISEIKSYHTVPEMLEWYIHRRHQNILECFNPKIQKEAIVENFFSLALNNYLESINEIYSIPFLPFAKTVASVSAHNTIVKSVVIYNELYNTKIEADIKNNFPETVKFIWGDFREILPQINSDSTFVFSDMNKLNIMAEMNMLNYRSVIVAQNYDYNLTDEGTFIADPDILLNKYKFNMAYLPAI